MYADGIVRLEDYFIAYLVLLVSFLSSFSLLESSSLFGGIGLCV